MTRRSLSDFDRQDEVIRRWQRRRWKVQHRDRAVADLKAEIVRVVAPIVARLNRLLGG